MTTRPSRISKVLSANDVGDTGAHQAGMLVPKDERVLASDPVPVIPMALTGLWGSFFSRKGGPAMAKVPRPTRRELGVTIGRPLPPQTSAAALQEAVQKLMS